ncbi:MAG: pyridoxal phosphate-dependent aminotransferase [Bacteroidales bacterium]|nr:pyridoxal phosphate-dependent aminotransferase [Bacteroidales bacterium]MDD4217996.1 pyridoxal phosphate-dependent aminotransferase [Bacteroidales bacterium]
MEKVSERLNRMSVSATLAMTQKSRELKAQGYDVINLSIGEPDFDTPEHVKEAAKRAIDENYTHYPPVPGYESLKKAIVNKFKRENNLEFDENQIVVSSGAKHSIINVFLAIIDPGDEVIIPAPYWVSYPDMVGLAEGVPVVIKCGIESDFKMTAKQLEQHITPKTRAIIYSSPSNPTGMLYSKDELEALAKVIEKHPNIIVISDEIYEHINFSGKHQSIAQFDAIKDRVVVVNGVSKGYAMTGWRIGYIGGPLWIAKAVTKLQGQFTSGACTIAQKAAEAALNAGSDSCKEMTAIFKKRRDLVMGLFKEINGIKMNEPQGAFYVFPEVSSFYGKSFENYTIKDSGDLALYILETEFVASVGGHAFGSPECLRFSYATSDDMLIEAISRIKRALSKLK